MKIKNGNPKHILKKAVRGIIPDELIDRKKQGYGVPIQEWFDRELGDFARKEIYQFTEQTDLLNRSEVEKHLSAANGTGFFKTWILLNVVLWWKEYIAQSSASMLQNSPAHAVPAS
jgi:asparagine synthase (glutamine-hydrolysing)